MPTILTTAAEAYEAANAGEKRLGHLSSPFVCPFPNCRVYAEHHWGFVSDINRYVNSIQYQSRTLEGSTIFMAKCHSCHQEVIFLDGKMIKPSTSEAPPPTEDFPQNILPEYVEAAAILVDSPRGAAALLRLAVQKLLPLLGANKTNINDQIGELVKAGTISARVQTSLDSLRVIGNEAVHPGTIDLKDDVDTAMGLFRLLNYIIEKAISEPRHADEMFAKLPQNKRDAISKRDGNADAN